MGNRMMIDDYSYNQWLVLSNFVYSTEGNTIHRESKGCHSWVMDNKSHIILSCLMLLYLPCCWALGCIPGFFNTVFLGLLVNWPETHTQIRNMLPSKSKEAHQTEILDLMMQLRKLGRTLAVWLVGCLKHGPKAGP